jgi:putative ABC transport system permease protein
MSWDLDLVRDARHGLRLLRTRPFLSALAILILAFGTGSTVAVFSFVDRLILRSPPYHQPDRVMTLWQTSADAPDGREGASPGAIIAWRERATSFEILAGVEPFSFDYLDGPEPQTLAAGLVTERFFDALGVQPWLGRTFLPEEHAAGRADVVIISYGAWQRMLGSTADIMGRTIELEGRPFAVVGVLPRWFDPHLLERSAARDVWAPKIIQPFERTNFRGRYWNAVGRLKPGVTPGQAAEELGAVSLQLAKEFPRTMTGMTGTIVPLHEHLAGSVREPLLILLAAIVFVLLIACANVASLLLAMGAQRRREFVMRTALGAAPARIVRQVLAESFTVSVVASLGGVALAAWAIGAGAALAPPGVPQIEQVAMDGRVLAFALALTVATTLLFGLAPALHASRPKMSEALGTVSQPPGRRRFASSLVVAEVSLAFILLVGSGLLLRSFVSLANVDPGFSRSGVVALQVFAYGPRYAGPERTRAFFDAATTRLRSVPGVETAGLVSAMPFLASNINVEGGFRAEGRPVPPPEEQATSFLTIASGDYFRAMRIPLRRGRLFEETDRPNGQPVAIINELLAERYWAGGNPVGEQISVNWLGRWLTTEVVGVVGRLRHEGLDSDPRPEVFLPPAQVPFGSMTFVVRSAGDPGALVAALKSEVWAIDATLPFYDVATIDSLLAQSLSPRRFLLWLLSGFAACAFGLAAAGIYGVLTFSTLQRTREMGVRMAMGAHARDITRLIVREGMTLVGAGVAIGVVASMAIARALSFLLYGVAPVDPLTLAAAVALLGTVALAACYVPARRATKGDPLAILKSEV